MQGVAVLQLQMDGFIAASNTNELTINETVFPYSSVIDGTFAVAPGKRDDRRLQSI